MEYSQDEKLWIKRNEDLINDWNKKACKLFSGEIDFFGLSQRLLIIIHHLSGQSLHFTKDPGTGITGTIIDINLRIDERVYFLESIDLGINRPGAKLIGTQVKAPKSSFEEAIRSWLSRKKLPDFIISEIIEAAIWDNRLKEYFI